MSLGRSINMSMLLTLALAMLITAATPAHASSEQRPPLTEVPATTGTTASEAFSRSAVTRGVGIAYVKTPTPGVYLDPGRNLIAVQRKGDRITLPLPLAVAADATTDSMWSCSTWRTASGHAWMRLDALW